MIDNNLDNYCQDHQYIGVLESIKLFYQKDYYYVDDLAVMIKEKKSSYQKKNMYLAVDHMIKNSLTALNLRGIDSFIEEDWLSCNDIDNIFVKIISYLYNIVDMNSDILRFDSNEFLVRDLRLFKQNDDNNNILLHIIGITESVWVFVILHFLIVNSIENTLNIQQDLDPYTIMFLENSISMIMEEWILFQNSYSKKNIENIDDEKKYIDLFDKKILKHFLKSFDFLNSINSDVSKILDFKKIEYVISSKINAFKVQLSNIFEKKSIINLVSEIKNSEVDINDKGNTTVLLKFQVIDYVDKIPLDNNQENHDMKVLSKNMQKLWLSDIIGIFNDKYKFRYILDNKEHSYVKKKHSLIDSYNNCIWILKDVDSNLSIQKFKDNKVFFYKLDNIDKIDIVDKQELQNNILSDIHAAIRKGDDESFDALQGDKIKKNNDKIVFASVINFPITIREQLFNKVLKQHSINQYKSYIQDEVGIKQKDRNTGFINILLSSSKFSENNMFGVNDILLEIFNIFEDTLRLNEHLNQDDISIIKEILIMEEYSELYIYTRDIERIEAQIQQLKIDEVAKGNLSEILAIKFQYIKLRDSGIIDEIIAFIINKFFALDKNTDNLKKKYNKEILDFFLRFFKFFVKNAKFDELIVINITNCELDCPIFKSMKIPNFISNIRGRDSLLDTSYLLYNIISLINDFVIASIPIYMFKDLKQKNNMQIKKKNVHQNINKLSMTIEGNLSPNTLKSRKISR